MAHEVDFTIPSRALGRADVKFQVKKDGSTIGTLTVSNGSIVWFPSGTTWGHKMRWSRFASMMEEHATRHEGR